MTDPSYTMIAVRISLDYWLSQTHNAKLIRSMSNLPACWPTSAPKPSALPLKLAMLRRSPVLKLPPGQHVFAFFDRRLIAGDDCTFQVNVVVDCDLETTSACLNPALLADAFKVAVNLALTGAGAAGHANSTHTDGAACAALACLTRATR